MSSRLIPPNATAIFFTVRSGPMKFLENPVQIFLRDTNPGIGHDQLERSVLPRRGNANFAALGEFSRIVEKVKKDLS